MYNLKEFKILFRKYTEAQLPCYSTKEPSIEEIERISGSSYEITFLL